mmetsp:Transcript_69663/g.62484  ORF Transcript_69663/g.62484 Transcript_69663/m.62484 type:complete len:144 (-) Transcript_69663:95-526(-)
MGECNWGIVWSVLNLICGLVITVANVFWALSGFFCGWYNLFFGVAIVWVSITTKCCDKYALAWFPFWGNFLFMGCTFLYLSCGGYACISGDCDWWGFCFFFVAVVGVIYVILWLIKTLAGVGIPDPVPLESCCGGSSDGYQKM